jgi:hypothetical protein
MGKYQTDGASDQRIMPDAAFLHLGDGEVAYIRPIKSDDMHRLFPQAPALEPGFDLWVLLGADGTPIMVSDSKDAVVVNAAEAELTTVSLH